MRESLTHTVPVKRHRGSRDKHFKQSSTRANRTRHTTSSSTQPHAKQQLTNAPQTKNQSDKPPMNGLFGLAGLSPMVSRAWRVRRRAGAARSRGDSPVRREVIWPTIHVWPLRVESVESRRAGARGRRGARQGASPLLSHPPSALSIVVTPMPRVSWFHTYATPMPRVALSILPWA